MKEAAVVNFSSVTAKFGNMGQCNYTASKAAVESFTKSTAKELAKLVFFVLLGYFIRVSFSSSVTNGAGEAVRPGRHLLGGSKPLFRRIFC